MKRWHSGLLPAVLATACACAARDQAPSGSEAPPLEGTSWQLVRFQGGDDSVLTPDDRSRYTLAFGRDGMVAVRLDCNRGRGPWRSPGRNRLELGALAITRAFCGPGSLHDQILKQWGYIRSYVVRDGHLFLALMADGGIYEFEPAVQARAVFKPPLASRGPVAWTCAPGSGGAHTLRVTFYDRWRALLGGAWCGHAELDGRRVCLPAEPKPRGKLS